MEETNADRNVEIWKIKKLIKSLEAARGNGTSMISLIIPPKDQISRISKMLADEFGTASNIKSRVNRLSVLGAITSVQHRLKLYTKVPPNGLVIYCGTIVTEEGKEKKVNIDFEPFKPINTSLYLCDNKFHTEALSALLADDNKFGFIVMDGNGALFGTLQGNTRDVLHKFTVDLPKKHGRGGQGILDFNELTRSLLPQAGGPQRSKTVLIIWIIRSFPSHVRVRWRDSHPVWTRCLNCLRFVLADRHV